MHTKKFKKPRSYNIFCNQRRTLQLLATVLLNIQVLPYQVPGLRTFFASKNSLRLYVLCRIKRRDIFYDQKYKHNLRIPKRWKHYYKLTIVIKNPMTTINLWAYCNRFFFGNGIHHHYSAKILSEFSFDYFKTLSSK